MGIFALAPLAHRPAHPGRNTRRGTLGRNLPGPRATLAHDRRRRFLPTDHRRDRRSRGRNSRNHTTGFLGVDKRARLSTPQPTADDSNMVVHRHGHSTSLHDSFCCAWVPSCAPVGSSVGAAVPNVAERRASVDRFPSRCRAAIERCIGTIAARGSRRQQALHTGQAAELESHQIRCLREQVVVCTR
ncbi:hypothetical protein C8K44_103252 [Aminobacter sp. AP02]|nr:hypothetical protein C8K44_103252 [Aminobacter sp. AP02]